MISGTSLKKEAEDMKFLFHEKSRANNEYQAEIAAVRDKIS
jgi:hypothetical protein